MTVDAHVEATIRRLYFGEHWKVGTIVSQHGYHHEVVERVLGLRCRVRKGLAAPRSMVLDGFRDFVDETLQQYPRLRCTRLFDMLEARGYQGSLRSLRSYVQSARPRPRSEVFVRTSPLIGEQAQVDWAYVQKMKVPGGTRALWAFVMTLAWSRALYAELVFDVSASSLLRSLVRACDWFGGSPRQWLFDNPKIVVLERHGDAVRFQPSLLELSGHYRVQLQLCRVRRPQDKGGVERAIRYLRDRFFSARNIVGVEEGNQQLQQFINTISLQRPHPHLPERNVGQCLEQERHRLLALPHTAAVTDQLLSVQVDRTATVRFDTNSYSVPAEVAGSTITLAASDNCLRFLHEGALLATHQRCWGKRQIIVLPEHREQIVKAKKRARPAQARDRLRCAVPQFDRLAEYWVEAGCNIGAMTVRTVRLLDLYGAQLLASAVEQIVQRGCYDPGALAIVCERERRARSMPVPIDIHLGPNVPEYDVIPHNLETYDDSRQ